MKRPSLLLYLFLCVARFQVVAESESRERMRALEAMESLVPSGPVHRSDLGVEFKRIDRNLPKFRITNHTKRSITLDAVFGNDPALGEAPNRPYVPKFPSYEYRSHKQWWTLVFYGDGLTYPYRLKPGKSVVWYEQYDYRLEGFRPGTLIRLRVGDFVSAPFRWSKPRPPAGVDPKLSSTDPDFGFSDGNPIKVGARSEQASRAAALAYLRMLRDEAGKPVRFKQLATYGPGPNRTIVSTYKIETSTGSAFTFYIDMGHPENAPAKQPAPMGLFKAK